MKFTVITENLITILTLLECLMCIQKNCTKREGELEFSMLFIKCHSTIILIEALTQVLPLVFKYLFKGFSFSMQILDVEEFEGHFGLVYL
jgi:hypothetical protein